MASKQWTEKQTKEIMKKVIRRAEVSRIARLLQHRLALASVKAQHGWENLTLDAIEPKVEDLKRKRQRSSQENSPSPEKSLPSQDGNTEWTQKSRTSAHEDRPSSRASDVGPLPTFQPSRKRMRGASQMNAPSLNKRQKKNSHGSNGRMVQSSPGYQDPNSTTPSNSKFQPTFHSSPPRTPPRRMIKPSGRDKGTGEEGADLLLYLATSPSPAMTKSRYVPTTPPSRTSGLPSSMMNTPGCPQTPQTGFNFADFVNITPSPAPGAFGPVGRGTPIANARKRLNFDQLAPPSGSPAQRHVGLDIDVGGNLHP